MKIMVMFFLVFSSELFFESNKLPIETEKETTIVVQYIENNNCRKCANWYLITGNIKEFDVEKSEKIYLKNKKLNIFNELDDLIEKQRPLNIALTGSFHKNKLNNFRVFEYVSFKIVAL